MNAILITLGVIAAIWIIGALIIWPWRSTSSFGSVNKGVAATWPLLLFFLIVWATCRIPSSPRRGWRRRKAQDRHL